MRRSIPVVFALAALLVAGLGAQARAEMVDKPLVVKVHADWCGTCTRLNPTWEQLQSELGDDAELVVLDVTDKDTLAASRARAEELGLVEFFDTYKSQTGTIAVLDARREPVVVLKGVEDVSRYREAVAEARDRQS